MGCRSGVGDRHWEALRGTDGWCRKKSWSPDQARPQKREELTVWALAYALPPSCWVTLEKSFALSEPQFIHV